MRPCLRSRRAELIAGMLALTFAVPISPASGVASDQQPRLLQLEAYINDATTHLIGSFVQLADGRIAARRSELVEIGIKLRNGDAADDLVSLDALPGVAHRYDEPTQRIFFTLGDESRIRRSYDAASRSEATPIRSDYGGVLNYTLFASSSKSADESMVAFSGANATLDARLFGPMGLLSQSAILGSTVAREFDGLRLDTTWSYSDPQSLTTYRAGDTISGGLAWTRPIRLGGLQVQRNFALRPDLVTLPLPTISGSAAVPSTIDVYVDNVKTHSQDVAAGPYQIQNVPVLSNGGTARVVLRDAAGREVETSLPFYASPKLLRPGFTDFSIEAGYPRLRYGSESNSYVDDPVGSASLRGGVHDWLTLETHAETASDLMNGGAGALLQLGSAGVLSVAGSASRRGQASGFRSYVAYDGRIDAMSFHASSQRTFADYNDLAVLTADSSTMFATAAGNGLFGLPLRRSARPPRSLDTFSVGMPFLFDRASLSLSYLRLVLDDGKKSDLVNLSFSRAFRGGGSFYLSAFSDLDDRKTAGIFVGVSLPLGRSVSASAGVASSAKGTNVVVDSVKSMQSEPGSYGWRLRGSEGATPSGLAAGAYRSSFAQVEGRVQQEGRNTRVSAQAEGAVAVLGGGMFLSNRINDSFAVVDTGAPGVDVSFENRPAGTTNARGQVLIPNLRSYQSNKIAIDPRELPVDADVPATQDIVAPADRSGVVVRFGIDTDTRAAVVILTDKDGKPIAPGSHGRLEGGSEPFVIGYDGRAYLKGLGETNVVVVATADSECRAAFPFTPKKNSQIVIGPVSCQ